MDPTRCHRCHRHVAQCLCDALTPVRNRTGVLVLQHPREWRHRFGTEPLARLGLERCRVEVARGDGAGRVVHRMDVPPGTALLYPRADAVDLARLADADRPRHLLVLDGTWPQSRRLYDHNPWLHALPHVRLTPEAPSRYRIRRAPHPDQLSTVEAIVAALRILEPGTGGFDALLDAFDRMVREQMRFAGVAPRWRRRHSRPSRRLPSALFAERLLVVAEEIGAVASEDGKAAPRAQALLHWVALPVGCGTSFAATVRPAEGLPSARRLAHAGLDLEAVRGGDALHAVRERFHAFARGAVLAAWNALTLQVARTALGWSGPVVLLKASYANLRGGVSGSLDDVLRDEGLQPAPAEHASRAARRAAAAVAIARWTRAATPPVAEEP